MWIHFCLLTAAAFLGAGKRRELAPFGSPRTRPKRSDVAVGPRAVAAKACARARRARARYKERERTCIGTRGALASQMRSVSTFFSAKCGSVKTSSSTGARSTKHCGLLRTKIGKGTRYALSRFGLVLDGNARARSLSLSLARARVVCLLAPSMFEGFAAVKDDSGGADAWSVAAHASTSALSGRIRPSRPKSPAAKTIASAPTMESSHPTFKRSAPLSPRRKHEEDDSSAAFPNHSFPQFLSREHVSRRESAAARAGRV